MQCSAVCVRAQANNGSQRVLRRTRAHIEPGPTSGATSRLLTLVVQRGRGGRTLCVGVDAFMAVGDGAKVIQVLYRRRAFNAHTDSSFSQLRLPVYRKLAACLATTY